MVEERRSFSLDDGKVYFIATPTAENIRNADWQYSKVFTKSLSEGINTSAEMMDILKQRGVIGPEFEQRGQELTDMLNERIQKLEACIDIDEKQSLAMEVANMREDVFRWNQRLQVPLSHSCESLADDARLEFLTYSMMEKDDGEKIWDSYNNFLIEKNQGLILRARFEVMLYLRGLDQDFLDRTPEAVAIQEVEVELQNKAEEAIQSIKDLTDKDMVDKDKQELPVDGGLFTSPEGPEVSNKVDVAPKDKTKNKRTGKKNKD